MIEIVDICSAYSDDEITSTTLICSKQNIANNFIRQIENDIFSADIFNMLFGSYHLAVNFLMKSKTNGCDQSFGKHYTLNLCSTIMIDLAPTICTLPLSVYYFNKLMKLVPDPQNVEIKFFWYGIYTRLGIPL